MPVYSITQICLGTALKDISACSDLSIYRNKAGKSVVTINGKVFKSTLSASNDK